MKKNALLRNLFHVSGSIIPVSYILFGRSTALFFSFSLFVILLILDILRITGRLRLEWAENCFKVHEKRALSGTFFYTLAATLTILFFDRDSAVAALFVLCIADPLSSLVGRNLGRLRLFGKTLEGSLTFLASSFLILSVVGFTAGIALITAVVAALTELFTPRSIDDNLSIPLVTALVLALLTRWAG